MRTLLFCFVLCSTLTAAQTPSAAMPIGTIVAWAGNPASLDPNWKICDGSQISKTLFPDLCAVLGNYWGPIDSNPAGAELFTLPDLRGVFLRGVNGGRNDAYADPEAGSRKYVTTSPPTSFQSNQVGSYQQDMFEQHHHSVPLSSVGSQNQYQPTDQYELMDKEPSTQTSDTGGTETRPVNAYVYWIIKAK